MYGLFSVVWGLVDQGEIIGVLLSLQTWPAGIACLLACGPIIPSTRSWVISLSATAVADSALDSLSS